MSLIIEDGTQVAGANSYVDVNDFVTYADAGGYTISGDEGELLARSMRFIETLPFIGLKYTKEQKTQWPRYNAKIDGFAINVTEIPAELLILQMEVGISIDKGIDPMGILARVTKSESVDVISVTYIDDSIRDTYEAVERVAKKLVSYSPNYARLSRA